MSVDGEHHKGPSTLDILTQTYGALRDNWWNLCTETSCDSSAPWVREGNCSTLSDSTSKACADLLKNAQETADSAGRSVLNHLKLLAMAYPAEGEHDDALFPGLAPFSLARTLLEGAAVLKWSLTPDLDKRLQRSARLQLWSAGEAQRARGASDSSEPLAAAEKLVKAAGFEVRDGRFPSQRLIVVNGSTQKTFQPSEAIEDLLQKRGLALYQSWSGYAHHAP